MMTVSDPEYSYVPVFMRFTTAGPLGLLLGTDIPVRLAVLVVPLRLACLPVSAGSPEGLPFKFRQSDPPVRATG